MPASSLPGNLSRPSPSVAGIYLGARRDFELPAGWEPAAWRAAAVVACGLTALAARAALRDAGLPNHAKRDSTGAVINFP